jgi:hypothetical protein
MMVFRQGNGRASCTESNIENDFAGQLDSSDNFAHFLRSARRKKALAPNGMQPLNEMIGILNVVAHYFLPFY